MGVLEIVGGFILIFASLAIMFCVVRQDSPRDGGLASLGAGTSDSYFSKNQGRTSAALLQRITKIAAALFFVVTIVVYAFTVQ